MAAPVFFKELPLILSVQGKPELVHLAAGFSKPVDALSGMTINLKDIMDWQDEWARLCASRDFSSQLDFLQEARAFFAGKAASMGAQVPAVQSRFQSGAVLRWDGRGASVARSGTVRDPQNVLRICELCFAVGDSTEVSKALAFCFPESVGESFSQASMVATIFRTQTTLKILRLAVMDPLSKISQVVEMN